MDDILKAGESAEMCEASTADSNGKSAIPSRCSRSSCDSRACIKKPVNCVPWFIHKNRKHQAGLEQSVTVNSIDSIKNENAWYRVEVHGQQPLRRSKHAAIMVGRKMYVVGGICSKGISQDIQELYAGPSEWQLWNSKLSPKGPPCAGHSLVLWDRKLFVLGGYESGLEIMDKAYAFDLDTSCWKSLSLSGEIPMTCTGQSIVHVGSMLILYGGEDAKGQLRNDIYILDLKTLAWLPSSTDGPKPCPRKGHTAVCYMNRYMWVFGGRSRNFYLNDVHCLDLQTMEWVGTKAKGNVIPRAGHCSVIVDHRWYIIGGKNSSNEAIGTLLFDLPTQTWSVVATVAPSSPLANDGVTLVKADYRNRSFLMTYGGHGHALSNQVYTMLLPPAFRLEKSFHLEKASLFRRFLSLLVHGKAERHKIRHPERHSSRPASSQSARLLGSSSSRPSSSSRSTGLSGRTSAGTQEDAAEAEPEDKQQKKVVLTTDQRQQQLDIQNAIGLLLGDKGGSLKV